MFQTVYDALDDWLAEKDIHSVPAELSSYTLAFTFCLEHLEIECISCEMISQAHNDKIIYIH